jgi:hypothetical protein
MKFLFSTIILILLSVFINACSAKKLTIKSLHPSKIEKEKIRSVKVEVFYHDDVNQTSSLEERIFNKIVDGQKIFILKDSISDVDAIIDGDVLNSSFKYQTYYKSEIDYSRCRFYRYDEKKNKKYCIEHVVRFIPCENREYNVTTNVKVIKPFNNTVIFSKTYDKSRYENICFDSPYPFSRTSSDKYRINSQIADQIAIDIIDDISPHYVYYNINIIEDLDEENILYTKEHKKRFEKSVDLIENKNLDLAKIELELLDKELKNKSFEVLYNLALIYEANNQLEIANKLYNQSKFLTLNIKYLDLINYAIDRTDSNLKEKIKAKSQLP